jgi:tetratricopeptide (TPR) repeat protein
MAMVPNRNDDIRKEFEKGDRCGPLCVVDIDASPAKRARLTEVRLGSCPTGCVATHTSALVVKCIWGVQNEPVLVLAQQLLQVEAHAQQQFPEARRHPSLDKVSDRTPSSHPAGLDQPAVRPQQAPLLQRLMRVIDQHPQTHWYTAALEFQRPPLHERGVSWSFICEFVRSLEVAMPGEHSRLNSYAIQGAKSLTCSCDAAELDNCTHVLQTASNPTLCERPWVIRALTGRSTLLSLVETLMIAAAITGDDSFTHDAEGQPFFGCATVFISYFWHAPFPQLAGAIGRRHDPASGAFYWIDILNVAQCRHTEQAAEWNGQDVGRFAETVAVVRAPVWLHCQPWHRPHTLTRVWCLDEVVASIDTTGGFEIMLAEEEEKDLRATLSGRFEQVLEAFQAVDARKANATHREDKEMIFGRICRRAGGFEGFNAKVVGELRRWLLRTARALLEQEDFSHNVQLLLGLGWLEAVIGSDMGHASAHFERAMTIATERHGTESAEVGDAHRGIAGLYQVQGRYDEALAHNCAAVATFEKVHGKELAIFNTHYQIAETYAMQGRHDEALRRYCALRCAYKKTAQNKGAHDPADVIVEIRLENCIAQTLHRLGRYDEALALLHAVQVKHEKVHGADPRSFHNTQFLLAEVYSKLGRYDEALALYHVELAEAERVYGADHPDVARRQHNVAEVYEKQGRYDEALALYHASQATTEKVHGADHFAVAEIKHTIACAQLKRDLFCLAAHAAQRQGTGCDAAKRNDSQPLSTAVAHSQASSLVIDENMDDELAQALALSMETDDDMDDELKRALALSMAFSDDSHDGQG